MAETAAQKYAALQDKSFEKFLTDSFSKEALKGIDLFEVKAPSGMVFKCRRLDMSFFEHSSTMPLALSAIVAEHQEGLQTTEDKIAAFQNMPVSEQRKAIQTAARMIRYITVEPRLIIGEVNGHKNAISTDNLSMKDFNCLAEWANGGTAAEGLKTFRSK